MSVFKLQTVLAILVCVCYSPTTTVCLSRKEISAILLENLKQHRWYCVLVNRKSIQNVHWEWPLVWAVASTGLMFCLATWVLNFLGSKLCQGVCQEFNSICVSGLGLNVSFLILILFIVIEVAREPCQNGSFKALS